MIHRGLIGTYERFVAILLEQTKGNLPFWIAPKQVTIIPVNLSENLKYANKVAKKLLNSGFRVKIDDSDERLNKKIRNAQVSKSKFQAYPRFERNELRYGFISWIWKRRNYNSFYKWLYKIA